MNYGLPSAKSADFDGTEWLRSGTGVDDFWSETQPQLEADLAFVQKENLGRVLRVFIGLDQAMVWDDQQGFVRFNEPTLQNFEKVLGMFDSHGMQMIAVLYDQEVVNSRGNFRFAALDGQHPAMRDNYLRATDIFLRRFGSSSTVIGWDLFNEAYNSLGRDGGLQGPPGPDPVSPNYANQTIHSWIRDLYRIARCAAPEANFTVSDTTELYWKDQPNVALYEDSVDFYDMHVYDDQPRTRDWKALLQKPFILGEVAGSLDQNDYRNQSINAPVLQSWLDRAREVGLRVVLAHAGDQSIYPSDRTGLTRTGQVLAQFNA